MDYITACIEPDLSNTEFGEGDKSTDRVDLGTFEDGVLISDVFGV